MDDVELNLPRAPVSVARARAAMHPLREVLGGRYQDAVLLVSELVTNAVRHQGTAGGIEMAIAVAGGRVRVEVLDPGNGFPKPSVSEPPPDSLGGRGLLIVDRVASRWGVSSGPSRVWFELDR